ncbi:hypothetical protein EXN66_Car012792 [Channa argus]|uniref:Uncharacterized protein n=1 Tax=Channa argus TaxID=215402 RepID=A0A6G1Q3N5_CHAAH|nr:hypothetical protein EXN66_Car012792 [Channa argus]
MDQRITINVKLLTTHSLYKNNTITYTDDVQQYRQLKIFELTVCAFHRSNGE